MANHPNRCKPSFDMTVFKTNDFLSVSAGGKDWREITRQIIDSVKAAHEGSSMPDYTLGILYLNDALISDAAHIRDTLTNVLKVKEWAGCNGIGVFSTERTWLEEKAVSLLLCRIPADRMCAYRWKETDMADQQTPAHTWIRENDPLYVLTHASHLAEGKTIQLIKALEQQTAAFPCGGVASARDEHVPKDILSGQADPNVSGIMFHPDVRVATGLSQGCTPLANWHTITKVLNDNIIEELDRQPAFNVFEQDLRHHAIETLGQDPDSIVIEESEDPEQMWDKVPEEFRDAFRGEVHIAFPVPGAEKYNYIVRTMMGVDPHNKALAVAHPVATGEQMMFVHRNVSTIRADLSRMLVELRKRVEHENGGLFMPQAALYVSCVARSHPDFGGQEELSLIREVIGDIPLAGFYAGGEILGNRLYNYTGILTLFL